MGNAQRTLPLKDSAYILLDSKERNDFEHYYKGYPGRTSYKIFNFKDEEYICFKGNVDGDKELVFLGSLVFSYLKDKNPNYVSPF